MKHIWIWYYTIYWSKEFTSYFLHFEIIPSIKSVLSANSEFNPYKRYSRCTPSHRCIHYLWIVCAYILVRNLLVCTYKLKRIWNEILHSFTQYGHHLKVECKLKCGEICNHWWGWTYIMLLKFNVNSIFSYRFFLRRVGLLIHNILMGSTLMVV